MKRILFLLFLIQTSLIFGQNLDSCGLDNQAILSQSEAAFLNEYFKGSKGDFDFSGKKIAFVTGSNGGTFGLKISYFDSVKEWISKNKGKIASDLIIFSNEEKINSGGYDAILTYWVMVQISEKKKTRLIERLAEL